MDKDVSLILTVDTGGTKTKLTLFDSEGKRLSSARCGGMGFIEDLPGGFPFLAPAINELIDDRDCLSVKAIVVNVGGKNTVQIEEAFKDLFPAAKVLAFRESSGIIMSALCDAEGSDAILMAGTGSIALAKGADGAVITDGWSPHLGDFGSGYWIGIQAISRSLKMLEGKGELSELCRLITGVEKPFAQFENTEEQMYIRDEIRSKFVPVERSKIADLCKTAAECATKGDPFAREIFSDAGHQLALTVIRALTIAELDEAEIFVSGGLTGCIELWQDSFDKTLKDSGKAYSWHTGESDMTKGAIAFAMENMV